MSNAKLLAKNTLILYSADILGRLLSVLLIIAIARYLGDFGLGEYSFAFAFVGMFSIIADAGISTFLAREFAKNKKNVEKWLPYAVALKIVLVAITLVLPIGIILLLGKSTETITLVIIASLALSFGNFNVLLKSIFQGFERMEFYSFIDFTERVIAAGVGITVLVMGKGIMALAMVIILSYFTSFVVAVILVSRYFTVLHFKVDFKKWKYLLWTSAPFWLTMLFMSLYFNIDTLMLSWFYDFSVVGWYSAAYKVINALFFIPLVLIAVVFPALSRFQAQSKSYLKLLYQKSFSYLVILALPIVIGTLLLADRIILFIY